MTIIVPIIKQQRKENTDRQTGKHWNTQTHTHTHTHTHIENQKKNMPDGTEAHEIITVGQCDA